MSANKHRPHVVVIPEDEADAEIVLGFRKFGAVEFRQLQLEPSAGGWRKVLEVFHSEHISGMRRNGHRHIILVFDFDGHPERIKVAKAEIPEDLRDRVFVLGALSEPERLRGDLGSFEEIGTKLAKDCRDGTDHFWGTELLRHNAPEVARIRGRVRAILFPGFPGGES